MIGLWQSSHVRSSQIPSCRVASCLVGSSPVSSVMSSRVMACQLCRVSHVGSSPVLSSSCRVSRVVSSCLKSSWAMLRRVSHVSSCRVQSRRVASYPVSVRGHVIVKSCHGVSVSSCQSRRVCCVPSGHVLACRVVGSCPVQSSRVSRVGSCPSRVLSSRVMACPVSRFPTY